MTKTDLIERIAAKTGYPKTTSGLMLNSVVEAIFDALKNGESVTVAGFGKFRVIDRKARNGRNPQTGEPMVIAARRAVSFSPGKSLSESINHHAAS